MLPLVFFSDLWISLYDKLSTGYFLIAVRKGNILRSMWNKQCIINFLVMHLKKVYRPEIRLTLVAHTYLSNQEKQSKSGWPFVRFDFIPFQICLFNELEIFLRCISNNVVNRCSQKVSLKLSTQSKLLCKKNYLTHGVNLTQGVPQGLQYFIFRCKSSKNNKFFNSYFWHILVQKNTSSWEIYIFFQPERGLAF